MQTVKEILPLVQIGLSIILIAAILLQQSGSSLGGAFGGGDNWSSTFHTRRGFEKILFYGSIIIAILFGLTSFLALIV